MSIRAACADDAPAICAIWNPLIEDSLVTFTTRRREPDEIAALIARRSGAFLVAERNGDVAGFATYGRFRDGPGYAYTGELTIHLAPDARGHGLGRALLARLEAQAARDGLHVMVAAISAANPAARAFHARMGYAQVGLMPQVGRKNGQWLDLILMQKIPGADPDTAAEAP